MTIRLMLTIPRSVHKRAIKEMISALGAKKWIIGRETGKDGYEHWQVRLEASRDQEEAFTWLKIHIPTAHVEVCTDNWDYEAKEHDFWCSWELDETRKLRFGKPNGLQREILRKLKDQGDREIDVWIDSKGSHGKSWLALWMYSKGLALIVPRASASPEKVSAFICSSWAGERVIILDIPRAQKIDPRLYETIEEIKDGLVFDHRYHGTAKMIRGVKVLVFSNRPLDTAKLSKDRWRIHQL